MILDSQLVRPGTGAIPSKRETVNCGVCLPGSIYQDTACRWNATEKTQLPTTNNVWILIIKYP